MVYNRLSIPYIVVVIDTEPIRERFSAVAPFLDERGRRLVVLDLTYHDQALYISCQGDRRCQSQFSTSPASVTKRPPTPISSRSFGRTVGYARTAALSIR